MNIIEIKGLSKQEILESFGFGIRGKYAIKNSKRYLISQIKALISIDGEILPVLDISELESIEGD